MTKVEDQSQASGCCGGAGGKNGTPEFSQLIPEDKKLDPLWIASLYQRGQPQTYSSEGELKYIGMPVSGICTGQVYLSGDGRLWHWDIFKAYGGSGEVIDPRGYHYSEPVSVKSPFEHGFVIGIHGEGVEQVRSLDSNGFSDIQFIGCYPIGFVNYKDEACPVEVDLQAYSPFIPLDEDNSGLPTTVVEYTFKNTSTKSLIINLAGWLENKICRYDDDEGKGLRRNMVSRDADVLMLSCFADQVEGGPHPSTLEGYGNMTLALLDSGENSRASAFINREVNDAGLGAQVLEQVFFGTAQACASRPFGTKTIGALGCKFDLAPEEEVTIKFAVSWFFPKYSGGYVFHSTMEDLPNLEDIRRHYAVQFDSSQAVAAYLAKNYQELSSTTKLWVETWYNSTLPYWFLDRTFINTSTLATQTCHRFNNGRFYAWEGVDCCQGTCQHVWQYAQSIARLFPAFERYVREHVDYDIAYKSDGSLEYRAECKIGDDIDMKSENHAEAFFAADGQLGTIIRVYREHTMSSDKGFLRRIWPRVKKSLQFMMTQDCDKNGLLDEPQFNTLDTSWSGEIPWISSLFLAALAAGKKMAEEMDDPQFAGECDERLQSGRGNIVDKLFNGEYFVHHPDPSHPESMDLTQGSYIDQVFGQGYAMQLGLERVIPEAESISALQSLWKYNYTPDVGPYRNEFKEVEGGRWYAMPGEGGLLMCTWPKNDCNRADFEQKILGLDVTSEGYLNECMTGFEYQVASHMMAEGMVEESLAITRTIHDRYDATKRNPWNEVECSDHYSRAMASYGVFLNACGFDYHGPDGHLAFAPKISPEKFKAAFTSAQAWGSYEQLINGDDQQAELCIKYGELKLNRFSVELGSDTASSEPEVQTSLNAKELDCKCERQGSKLLINFAQEVILKAGDIMQLSVTAPAKPE